MARSDLPNHTELVVAADPGWVRGRGLLLDTVRDLVTRSVASAASPRVSMDLVFHTLNDDTLADIVYRCWQRLAKYSFLVLVIEMLVGGDGGSRS